MPNLLRPLVLAAAILLTAAAARAAPVLIGVNAFFPQWGPPGSTYASVKRQETGWLNALQEAGVHLIRTDINTGSALYFYPAKNTKQPGYIHDAFARGIGTDVIVGPAASDYTAKPGCPRTTVPWEKYPDECLSAANPAAWQNAGKLQSSVVLQLNVLESQGVKLTAIEVMNEINWSNGDLNAGANHRGRSLTLADLNNPNDPEGAKVAAGYLTYLKLLAVVKTWRDHSHLNRSTPIISAGLADWGSATPPNDIVPIPATLAYLRAHGLDQLVDGYGVHTYQRADNSSAATRIAYLQQDTFAACGNTKPCWLTEWGFVTQRTACPLSPGADAANTAGVAVMRQALENFAKTGRLAAALYFEWPATAADPPGSRGIYGSFPKCPTQTGLTPSGKLALAPLP